MNLSEIQAAAIRKAKKPLRLTCADCDTAIAVPFDHLVSGRARCHNLKCAKPFPVADMPEVAVHVAKVEAALAKLAKPRRRSGGAVAGAELVEEVPVADQRDGVGDVQGG